MVRQYPHRPDEAFADESYEAASDGVGEVAATIGRQGPPAHEGIVNAGLDAVLEAMAWGWFLERPVAELRAHLPAALGFVRHGLAHPRGPQPEPASAARWIAVCELAGDGDLAASVGRAVASATPARAGEEFTLMLAALARGDDAAAGGWADALTAMLRDPGTAPFTVSGFAHLDELGRAVIAQDQAGLDAAARARGDATAAFYRRTAQTRRDWIPLLDHFAAAVVLVGARRGLRIPEGVPSLPVHLLTGS